jgi:hypothetical protein
MARLHQVPLSPLRAQIEDWADRERALRTELAAVHRWGLSAADFV